LDFSGNKSDVYVLVYREINFNEGEDKFIEDVTDCDGCVVINVINKEILKFELDHKGTKNYTNIPEIQALKDFVEL
jgi:hypothetical protein